MPADRLIRIDADLGAVRQLAEAVRKEAVLAGLRSEAIVDLELALVEAVNNIVIHGYLDEAGAIELCITRDSGVRLELRDWGRRIPEAELKGLERASPLDESGRGIAIIRACVDLLDYRSEEGLNRLTLFKGL